MRCTSKFKADGGTGVGLMFHSADKKSLALFHVETYEAEGFEEGVFYDFEVLPQQKRTEQR